MIDALVETGHRAKLCCRLLGVSSPGYYKYKKRPMSPTQMRRQWLTGLIREVHTASRQTYGSRRVHAEPLGMGVKVSERLVAVLMSDAKIVGVPGAAKVKRLHGIATADDLVHRKFHHRLSPNELWVTDITEHPRRYCPVFRASSTRPNVWIHSTFLPSLTASTQAHVSACRG